MRQAGITLLTIFTTIITSFFSKAQVTDNHINTHAPTGTDTTAIARYCPATSSSLLFNSTREKDDWQIISGPAINGIRYPVQASYTRPFPSWEMDRYTLDSSYFKNCEWMVLPDKKTVINTESRLPVVFIKRFTTIAPSKMKLIVKMLYDNMAWLYIDSNRITLNHPNADINRFIKKLQPAFSGFVSLPGTFNFSYNASFYAGDFYDLVLPAGEHSIKIELFNNAYELGCIIKGMLISCDDEKIFCSAPVKDAVAELANILIFRGEKAFPTNKIADTLYAALMQSVKTCYWINNMLNNSKDFISNDTIFMKKGENINSKPAFITTYYNGNTDTLYTRGSLKKITTSKATAKGWEKAFDFTARAPGIYQLEIIAEARQNVPGLNKYTRIIKVK